jgi:hypothetical protein
MMAVSEKQDASVAKTPQRRQNRLCRSIETLRNIVVSVWVLPVLAIIWGIVITLGERNLALQSGLEWAFTFSWAASSEIVDANHANDVSLAMDPSENNRVDVSFPFAVQVLIGVIFACAIQGSQTMGLHCIELLVNMTRDEEVWRAAYSSSKTVKSGAFLQANAFISAVRSWPNIVLFVAKALLHWILSQSLLPYLTVTKGEDDYSYTFTMVYVRKFVFAIAATSLAVFTKYLAIRRPGGCQPATWGHFQTLSNLIDDRNFGKKGDLWWGDKGVNTNGIRHASTSGTREDIGRVQMDNLYA